MNKACLVSLAGLAALSLAATKSWAQCSNGSLSGTYAFEVHGQSITVGASGGFTSTGLIDGIGQADFDGNGTFHPARLHRDEQHAGARRQRR